MASDPTTWAELKTAVASWADRDDDTIDTITAEIIALAERRFQRDVFSPERVATDTLQTVAATETVALPTDLWALKSAYINSDPKTVLEPMTLAELRNTYASSASAKPQNYAVMGESLVLGPVPDGAYDIEISYIETIPALGDSQATNWLLTDHPDLYLQGALVELFTRFRDTEGVTIHEARYQMALGSVNKSSIRRTQGSAPIRIRSPVVV